MKRNQEITMMHGQHVSLVLRFVRMTMQRRPSSSLLCVICMSCYSQLLQVHKQQRRKATLKRHGQVDGSGNGTGANDVPAADSAPAEQGAVEEGTALSDSVSSSAEQGVVIRCPICMDTYSEIVQSGRLMVATMCGHVFCSECLPVALETVGMCPTCREELTPDLYIPIYL
ncbi:E3 ubiquitin-protein ligase RNF185-like [Motacilla alba alba]|uniref:E3 ubiquitin-protein ligase RNF185-like n=1 Tax=Motacilla alba alba TaxID=1094192 RepID=UPI0018D4EAF5|nr:E3 ubiquitin-protein ligase RNF185-like [Motacilla alba alba]